MEKKKVKIEIELDEDMINLLKDVVESERQVDADVLCEVGTGMKSEWRYLIRKLAGKMVYQVYRLKDINAIDNYDNREYAGDILYNKQDAILLAGRLNAKEKAPGAAGILRLHCNPM